ncbi:MAG: Crp/Fnr family transcriptional regulator [Sandaracinaceae bacterium]|nr:MAG: Crp/Fnr family transcriptional regulator [Sandaracinaceae bacterium]
MADDQLFARFGKTSEPGEVLFREGEHGEEMYVLQEGAIRITKAVKGEEKTLALLGPGEFFGEMAILNAKPRTATAVVEQQAKVLVLGAKAFERMVVSNAEIAVRLIKRLARRLDSANELIEVLMHRDPKARVILGLSREAQFLGQPQDDGSVVVPLTEAELAEQVGLSESETVEVLKRLRRLQIVDPATTDSIVVRDVSRLDEFYEFLEMREKFGDG